MAVSSRDRNPSINKAFRFAESILENKNETHSIKTGIFYPFIDRFMNLWISDEMATFSTTKGTYLTPPHAFRDLWSLVMS